MTQTINLDIFGCCFSRDTIAFHDNPLIHVNNHVHYTSQLSAIDDCILPDNYIKSWNDLLGNHDFVKRCVFNDFYKYYWPYKTELKDRWIIVDFGNLRHPLGIIYNEGMCRSECITYSKEARENIQYYFENNISEGFSFRKRDIFDISSSEIQNGISSFFSILFNYYDEEKVILLDGRGCKYYIKDGRRYEFEFANHIDRVNELYENSYSYTINLYPRVHYIPYLKKNMGDGNHKWGLSWLHYIKPAYDYYYSELCSIIFGTDKNDAIRAKDEIERLYDSFE